MRKKILFFMGVVFLIGIAACSSPEEDEVLNFHNDIIDNLKPKNQEMDELLQEMDMAETDEEAYDIHHEQVLPLSQEIKKYIDEQDPKEEATQEYHELFLVWADSYYKLFQKQDEALEELVNGSEEQAYELLDEAADIETETVEHDKAVDEKFAELKDEFGFEEEE